MGRFAISALVLVAVLTGCAPERELPMPVPTLSSSPSASPGASAVPDDPQSSATAAKALFDATNEATVAAKTTGGRDFIDALVAAGFDKSAMEVTPDKTAIGLGADNVQFSVRFGSECLVGQFGNVAYTSAILPALTSGKCFIGKTRAIDW